MTADGTAKFAGKLADGTKFAATSRTVDDGKGNWMVPVHVPLYTGLQGMLVGEIILPNPEPKDAANVTGNLGWLRPKNHKAMMFQSGFLKEIEALGERYQVRGDQSILSGTGATANFTLTFDPTGVVLRDAIIADGTWPVSNVPLLAAPATAKISFTKSTGLFKGRFTQILNGHAIIRAYEGAVISHPLTPSGETTPLQGGGFFMNGNTSGRVELTSP